MRRIESVITKGFVMRTWKVNVTMLSIILLAASSVEGGWLNRTVGPNERGCADEKCHSEISEGDSGRWCQLSDNCENECDCDRACCEHCGKKKPKKRKKCCLFVGLECAEPPRGQMGVAVPGRLQRFSFDDDSESANNSKANSEDKSETGGRDRIDELEERLTRLTLVVEEVAGYQKKQQKDLESTLNLLDSLNNRMEPKR